MIPAGETADSFFNPAIHVPAVDCYSDAGPSSRECEARRKFPITVIKMADFTVNNADVSLSGASDGTINLSGRLDADLSGASRLEYIGEPTLGDMNITGASTLKKK